MRKILFMLTILIIGSSCDIMEPQSPQDLKKSASQKERKNTFYPHYIPQSGPIISYLALGNSITNGIGTTEPKTKSFPARIKARLEQKGWIFSAYSRRGYNGITSDKILAYVDTMTWRHWDFVTLEIGVNDAYYNIDLPRDTQAAKFARNLFILFEHLEKVISFDYLFISTLPQANKNITTGAYYESNRFHPIYNNEILNLAANHSDKIMAVRVEFLLDGTPLYYSDFIHLNDQGSDLMADLFVCQITYPIETSVVERTPFNMLSVY